MSNESEGQNALATIAGFVVAVCVVLFFAGKAADKLGLPFLDLFKDKAGTQAESDSSVKGDCWLGGKCPAAFSQADPRWASHGYAGGTMKGNGCGPAAMAMIVTALTGKQVTPVQAADYATSRDQTLGGASKWTIAPVLAEHWGLKARRISPTVSDITAGLKTGGLVIASGDGHLPFVGDPNGGHYIVIRALAGKDKVRVGDPGHRDTSTKTWDLATIASDIRGGHAESAYVITK